MDLSSSSCCSCLCFDFLNREDAVPVGSGPSDRAPHGLQAPARGGGEDAVRSGTCDSCGGMERAASEVSGDGVW